MAVSQDEHRDLIDVGARTLLGAKGIATRSKDTTSRSLKLLVNKKLLGAKGIATSNKKLLGAPGIATSNKKLLFVFLL